LTDIIDLRGTVLDFGNGSAFAINCNFKIDIAFGADHTFDNCTVINNEGAFVVVKGVTSQT
jgi:hypothetical protein